MTRHELEPAPAYPSAPRPSPADPACAATLGRSADEPLEPAPLRATPYLLEVQSELLQALRQPAYVVPTLLFPAMFYFFFGVFFGRSSDMASYLLATYGAFGVIGTALFGFGVSVAVARDSGELRLKRVAPVPPLAQIGGMLATSLVFSSLVIAELFVLAAAAGDVRLERGEWIGLAAVLLAGSVPFAAAGLVIGAHTSGKAAPALINLLYLPMAFLSGLWIPIEVLPGAIQTLAVFLPPYHLAELALGVLGRGAGQPAALHAGLLLDRPATGRERQRCVDADRAWFRLLDPREDVVVAQHVCGDGAHAGERAHAGRTMGRAGEIDADDHYGCHATS